MKLDPELALPLIAFGLGGLMLAIVTVLLCIQSVGPGWIVWAALQSLVGIASLLVGVDQLGR